MAELLGFVSGGAGIASLAVQLGNSALKIRRIYKAVQDAPAFLEDTAYDLETFSHALCNLERDRQNYNTVEYMVVKRCIEACERSVAKVRLVADRMGAIMLKAKTWNRMRTAVDKPELERLCGELERAKTSLGLALQLYTEACRKKDVGRLIDVLEEQGVAQSRQAQLLASYGNNLEQVRSVLFDPPLLRHDSLFTPESSRRMKNRNLRRIWRLRFAPWCASRIWEVSIDAAKEGFSINLMTANKVPPTAMIFKACEEGDLALVKTLLRDGKASPFDFYECHYVQDHYQTPTTVPVLAAAVHWGRLDICNYLIDVGGHPVIPANSYRLRNAYAWRYLLSKRAHNQKDAVEMYQFLLDLIEWNPELDHLQDPRTHWSSQRTHFNFFKNETDPLDYDLSLFTQGSFSPTTSDWSEFRLTPVLALGIIRATSITHATATSRDEQGRTALHRLAVLAACTQDESSIAFWVDFTRELLSLGADLHARSDAGMTPLAMLLEGQLPEELSQLVDPEDLDRRLQAWTRLLELADVDLISYGQTEDDIWERGKFEVRMPFKELNKDLYRRAKGFAFGTQAGQWIVRFGLFVPVYELRCLPGTWPTDASSVPTTICWHPRDEDVAELSWYWKHTGFAQISCHVEQKRLSSERPSALNDECNHNESVYRSRDDLFHTRATLRCKQSFAPSIEKLESAGTFDKDLTISRASKQLSGVE